MHNSRFREIAPSLEAELIATRVQFDYHPGDYNGEQTMVATWYGQEFLPVGDNLEPLGERGPPLRTTLSDYLTTVLEVEDPVTGESLSISAAAAVLWLKEFYDHAYNLQFPPHV